MGITERIWITDRLGLSLRVAAELVRVASRYKCRIELDAQGRTADAKSLLNLIGLAIPYGSEVLLTFEGEDALEAVMEVTSLLGGIARMGGLALSRR